MIRAPGVRGCAVVSAYRLQPEQSYIELVVKYICDQHCERLPTIVKEDIAETVLLPAFGDA